MPGSLVFGTFHFVRGENRLAQTPACTESAFFDLVEDFYSKGILASSEDFNELRKNGTKNLISKPNKTVFFTFDDGYIEHYDFCADVLEQFNSRGLFFPVVNSLVKRTVLDVNVIQIICSNEKYSYIAKEWLARQELVKNPLINSSSFSPAIYDDSNIRYIKRHLQSSPDLLEMLEIDTSLISQVLEDNLDYFNNLYFDYNQACDLHARGHILGGHSKTHSWLTRLQPDALESELRASLSLIKDVSANKEERVTFFCYPYGLTNKNVSNQALSHFNYCFTTEFGLLNSGISKEIPRVDVNELREFL